ncbi:acyclic terpene utilization AtuA family protein, partial [Sphaerisporangium rufum]|uniref:acyclic terpene utilization AtuA family protein n=1 Tax=Sphaerisporangium rufum TaxID=1381558 RepID=UPI001EF2D2E1
TGGPPPAGPLTANAYLGGRPVAEALRRGADVVVTGRITDAALVTGPGIWRFGWGPGDLDALAGSVAAGHVIECGCQATGGNYAFFAEVPGIERCGFPIAELHADGSSVITKHPGTGGRVTIGTVTAQLLYEIGSPRYLGPDVTARFDTIRLAEAGTDRVRISGVRGEPPPETLKVALGYPGGYRNTMTFVLTGLDIPAKARLAEDAVFARVPRETFRQVHVERVPLAGPSPAWPAPAGPDDRPPVRPPASTDPSGPPASAGPAPTGDAAAMPVRPAAFTAPSGPPASAGPPPTGSPRDAAAMALLRITVLDPDPRVAGRAFSSAAVETALASYPGCHLLAPPGEASAYGVYRAAAVPAAAVRAEVWLDGERVWTEPAGRPGPPADAPAGPPPATTGPHPGAGPEPAAGQSAGRPAPLAGGGLRTGPESPAGAGPETATEAARAPAGPDAAPEVTVPLGVLAGARSGDKGGDANLGVWVRTAEHYAWLSGFLTTDRLRALLPRLGDLPVERHELPNLLALNFVVRGLLGQGVAANPALDAQAKALGEELRARPVPVPAALPPPPPATG